MGRSLRKDRAHTVSILSTDRRTGKKSGSITFPFTATVKNFGRSPATDEYDSFSTFYTGLKNEDEGLKKLIQFVPCDDRFGRLLSHPHRTIFPDDTVNAMSGSGGVFIPTEKPLK